MILAYSERKINTNPHLLYSTLNPETNSDSPSDKSNGVRLISAKILIKRINLVGQNKIISHRYFWIYIILYIFNELIKKRHNKKEIEKVTS